MELEIKNISPQKLKAFMLSSDGPVNFLFNGEKAGTGILDKGKLEMDFYIMPNFLEEKNFIEGKQILSIPKLIDENIKEIIIKGKEYNTKAILKNNELSIENDCDKIWNFKYDTRPMVTLFCDIVNKIEIPKNVEKIQIKNNENGNFINGTFKNDKKVESFELKTTYGDFSFKNDKAKTERQGMEPANALILEQNFAENENHSFFNEIKKITADYQKKYFEITENEIIIKQPNDEYVFQFSKGLSVNPELQDKKIVIENPSFATEIISFLPDGSKLFDKENNFYTYDRNKEEIRQNINEKCSLQELVDSFIFFERNRDIEDDRKFVTSYFGNAIEIDEDFEGLKITTFAMSDEKLNQFQNLEVSKNIKQIRIEDMYKKQFVKFSDELSKEKVKELKGEILEEGKIKKFGGEFLYKGEKTSIMPEEERKNIKKENQKTR